MTEQLKTVFACGNAEKCTNSISADGLNKIKLEALRRWPRTCENCGKLTRWTEQQALFDNIEVKPKPKRNGGRRNAKSHNPDHIH